MRKGLMPRELLRVFSMGLRTIRGVISDEMPKMQRKIETGS